MAIAVAANSDSDVLGKGWAAFFILLAEMGIFVGDGAIAAPVPNGQ